MVENISKLVQQTQAYTKDTQGKIVHAFFEDNPNTEGVVIVDEGKPIGLVTRNDFYQKIGSQFGYTLYMKRPISLIMNKNLLVVEASADVVEVCFLAMNREQANMYDLVVVVESGIYMGIVSIKLFLIELTKQREKENIAIRNLLDNAGQGFLSFGEDMVISEEYSRECINIFNSPIGGKSFINLIGGYIDAELKETIHAVFQNAFKVIDRYQVKVYLSLLPEELIINGKSIRLDYKTIHDSSGYRIMLILTDITDKKELEMQMLKEKNNLKLVIKAISNQSELTTGLENFREFFRHKVQEIINSDRKIEDTVFEIYRAIHTFKGDFGQLYMYNTASELHEIENSLSRMTLKIGHIDRSDLRKFIERIDCNSLVEKDMKIIADTLGENYFNKGEVFTVSKEKIIEIEEKILTNFSPEQQDILLPMVRSLRYCNFKDIIIQYNDYLHTLAQKLDKSVSNMLVHGDDIFVDKSLYYGFSSSLVHIFKNIVDHGIETMEERLTAGKPEEGEIECELKLRADKKFCIYIRDDGRGIDFEKVKKKALDRKVYTPEEIRNLSEKDLLKLLFTDGFSTKDSVSIISGRGVGLGAVKSEIENLCGEFNIVTEPGRGTEFGIMLPLL